MQEKINQFKEKSKICLEHLKSKLAKIRTGRANPIILDHITVNYFESNCPINQLATISVPEPQQLAIKPYDMHNLSLIVNAINKANMGFQAQDQNGVIRINIPPLTEERRKEMVKQVKSSGEQSKVEIRNHRRNFIDIIKKSDLSKDRIVVLVEEIEKLTNNCIGDIDKDVSTKSNDLMKI